MGKNSIKLDTSLPREQSVYLDIRCANAGLVRAQAARVMFNLWIAMGAPPLSDLETLKPAIPIPQEAYIKLGGQFAELEISWVKQWGTPRTIPGTIPNSPVGLAAETALRGKRRAGRGASSRTASTRR